MPAIYAHYSFGMNVLQLMDPKPASLVKENLMYYHIGLHGPDLLFYYDIFYPNPVSLLGHEIHSRNATEFFENAGKVIAGEENPQKSTAYILGFLSHFMLDSECHPVVGEKMESSNLSHYHIETAFDRLLMEEKGLDPLSYRPTSHLNSDSMDPAIIARFFDGISPKVILDSIGSMKSYNNLLVAPGKVKRVLLQTAMKAIGQPALMDLMMKEAPDPSSMEIARSLRKLYEEAIPATASLVEQFYETLPDLGTVSHRLNRNFNS